MGQYAILCQIAKKNKKTGYVDCGEFPSLGWPWISSKSVLKNLSSSLTTSPISSSRHRLNFYKQERLFSHSKIIKLSPSLQVISDVWQCDATFSRNLHAETSDRRVGWLWYKHLSHYYKTLYHWNDFEAAVLRFKKSHNVALWLELLSLPLPQKSYTTCCILWIPN